MNVSELPLRLGRIADALQERAAPAAADAMAQEFDRVLVGTTLRMRSGSPSPPGQPPALESGHLRQSVKIVPAAAAGPRASAEVHVTAIYARIQEKGGTVTAKRFPVLGNPKAGFFGTSVTLKARPYMEPTRAVTVGSGQLQRAAAEAVKAVVAEGGA